MQRIFSAVLIMLLLAGCASRSVREPPAALVDFESAFGVRELWSIDTGPKIKDWVGLTPALSGDTLYVAGATGRIIAVATDNGRVRWKVELRTRIGSAVGVGAGLVVVGSRDGEVFALNQDTGDTVWRAPVSSEVLARPAVANDVVVVQTVDGKLTGLSISDGKRLWVDQRAETALSLRGTSAPVIMNDAVIAAYANGKAIALDLRSGRQRWETTVAQPRGRNEIERLVDVDATPLVLSDGIYVASYQGKLVVLQPSTGNVGWTRDVSTYTGLVSDGQNIYLTDDSGAVLAFDRYTGASIWKQDALHGRSLNAPLVYGDAIVVADFEGYVHWLARSDGHFIARQRASRAPVRAPVVSDGERLFIFDQAGTLTALQPREK